MPAADKTVFQRLFVERRDWLPGRTGAQKIEVLRRTSYADCLRTYAGVSEHALKVINSEPNGLWGLGWDALSGLEAVRLYQAGTIGLGLDPGCTGECIQHQCIGLERVARFLKL